MSDTITLQLSLDEINIILKSLGTQPYQEVSQLIGNIRQQGYNQLQQEDLQQTPASEEE